MQNNNEAWPELVVQQLTELHAIGMSRGLIARKLNETFGLQLTRNAVIGKAQRMKLERPPVNKQQLEARGLWLKGGGVTGARKKREKAYSVTELKAPEGKGLRLEDLLPFRREGSTSCRYPIGVSQDHGHEMFCGEATRSGSWCPYHCEFVFRGGRFASRV